MFFVCGNVALPVACVRRRLHDSFELSRLKAAGAGVGSHRRGPLGVFEAVSKELQKDRRGRLFAILYLRGRVTHSLRPWVGREECRYASQTCRRAENSANPGAHRN